MVDKVFLKFIESEIEHSAHSGDKAWFFGKKNLSRMFHRQAELFEDLRKFYVVSTEENKE